MATITPDKTPSVSVLAHQAATHPVTIVGGSISALTKKKVILFLYHGYVETGDDSSAPGKFKVQVRPDAGGGTVNEHWTTVAEYVVKGSASIVDEDFTATEAAGVKVCAVAATAGFATEDEVYIHNSDTLASSEWAEVQQIVTNTSIDILDGLTVGQNATDSTFYSHASKFVCPLNLDAMESYRVVWSHEGAAGINGQIKVEGITHDSDAST